MVIKLAAFDVDGVLTDGSLTFDENGHEYKTFNAKDGQGIVNLYKAGIITAIITARENGTVFHRAKNLRIHELHQGVTNKIETLKEIMAKYNFSFDEVSYMGDDLPDICILQEVKLAACPNDAVDEVKAIANFISSKNGGRGAVRELCDKIIKENKVEEGDKLCMK